MNLLCLEKWESQIETIHIVLCESFQFDKSSVKNNVDGFCFCCGLDQKIQRKKKKENGLSSSENAHGYPRRH